MKRGQAAVEFLLTYGWMLLVVLAAIAALAYFGVLSPAKLAPAKCTLQPGLACIEHSISDKTTTLAITNSIGADITITSVKVQGCTGTASGELKNSQQGAFPIYGCSRPAGQRTNADVNITYYSETGLTHINRGTVTGLSRQSISETRTLSFRSDGSSVNEIYDTYVTEDSPNTNYGTSTDIRVDGAGPHGHGLIAFPSIFGPGGNQIPFGAQIDLATLTVNCWNSGNTMNAYLLLENWTQTGATWNSRDGTSSWTNPGADGAGSRDSTATAWTCMPTGVYHYTMTPFISKWSNGTANYGIVLIDTGDDGNGFNSHEDPVVFEKPQLNVTFTVYT